MKQEFHYATVTEAIDQLRTQGYTLDLNLKENEFLTADKTYSADEFEIVDLYRYEGPSDPADESIVYALATKAGVKGIMVSGYGATSDEVAEEVMKKLHYKYLQSKREN